MKKRRKNTTGGNLGAYAGTFLIVFVFSMILTYIIISKNLVGILGAFGKKSEEDTPSGTEMDEDYPDEDYMEEEPEEDNLLEPGGVATDEDTSSEKSTSLPETSDESKNVPEKVSPSDLTSEVVPKVKQTDNDYFKYSLFVGDRQTLEFSNNNKELVKYSLAKDEIEPEKAISANIFGKTGSPNNLVTSIGKYKPSHIYVMLGARSITYLENKDSILYYEKFIDETKKIQPTTPIYIQSVIPITKDYESGKGYKNTKILELNEELKKMCEKKGIYYLDVSKDLQDSDGYLKKECVNSGGLILNAEGQKVWEEYLKTHWIDF